MIRADMIPPEVVEAAARAVCEAENGPCKCLPDECGCIYWLAHARASILAALNAWPGSYSLAENDSAEIRGVAAIILPLPQEVSDDA